MTEQEPGGGLALCVNGHRMLAVSLACPVCGAGPSDYAYQPPSGVHVAEREPQHAPGSLLTSLSGALIAVAMAVTVLMSGGRQDEVVAAPTDPGASPSAMGACDGLAEMRLEINQVLPDAPEQVCLTLAQQGALTITAQPTRNDTGLRMRVETAQGAVWAEADSTSTGVARIDSIFAAGTYVIYVHSLDGGAPPPFGLLAEAFESSTPDPSGGAGDPISSHIPPASECGDELPLISDSGRVPLTGGASIACLRVTEDSFVKFGAETLTPSGFLPPDIILTFYAYEESGQARFWWTFDDAFGSDPEASADLPAGTYAMEIQTFTGEPIGDVEVYADTTGTYIRRGAVLPVNSWVNAQTCDDPEAPQVALGESVTVEGSGDNYACLTLATSQRVRLAGSSSANQDLALEVIEVSGATPARVAWSDDDLFSPHSNDVNPLLSTTLPAGRFVVVFLEANNSTIAPATLTVTPE